MLRMGVRKGAVGIMKTMISDCEDDEAVLLMLGIVLSEICVCMVLSLSSMY
jgi:hypothetical protein